jgi:hypothetical protein
MCSFYHLPIAMRVLCFTVEHFWEVLHSPVNFEITYPYWVILRHKTIGSNFLRRFVYSQFFFVVCST